MPVLLRKLLIGSGVALCAAVVGQNAVAGFGDDLHWQSVIGIAQPNNVVGSGTGAVTGGGAPWSAFDGHVNVDLERGDVNFDVHGLVLAAGNSIGTRGTIAAVKGTSFATPTAARPAAIRFSWTRRWSSSTSGAMRGSTEVSAHCRRSASANPTSPS